MSREENKLPVYLLVECSSSISGEPIEAVRQNIEFLLSDLKSKPQALETVYLSVITFNDSARQVVPLTELISFNLPELQTSGSANLSEAFYLLKNCINRDKNIIDKQPVIFLFTFSPPTDKISILREAKEVAKLTDIVACAASPYVDTDFLEQITNNVLMMNCISEGDLACFIPLFFGNSAPYSTFFDESISEVIQPLSSNKNFTNKGVVNMENYSRRLPVYLLLDCSGSMSGEPIEAVRQGIDALLSDLKSEPQALETAYLSVITFDSTAQQVVPLTDLMSFNTPELHASGLTSLGGALHILKDCIQRELIPNTSPNSKGDWKPLVFLLTDGCPTDGDVLRNELQDLSSLKAANVIACAAGPYADTTVLKQITNNVLMMNNLSAGDLASFFSWVTQSIKTSSQSVTEKPGEPFVIAPPPKELGFTVVP